MDDNFYYAQTKIAKYQNLGPRCRMNKAVAGSLHLFFVVIFRILLALAQLFILLEDPVSALPYALNCLTISCSHFMDNSAALASLYIAQIQVYSTVQTSII